MKIMVCDRCRERIPDGMRIGHVSATFWNAEGLPLSKNPYDGWDLCEDCMKKIVLLIDGTIDAQLEPEALARGEEGDLKPADGAVFALRTKDPENEEPEEDPEEEDPEETEAVARIAGNPKQKPVNLRELRELVKQGKTAQEIANHFGISVATYYKHRKKAEHLYITGNL